MSLFLRSVSLACMCCNSQICYDCFVPFFQSHRRLPLSLSPLLGIRLLQLLLYSKLPQIILVDSIRFVQKLLTSKYLHSKMVRTGLTTTSLLTTTENSSSQSHAWSVTSNTCCYTVATSIIKFTKHLTNLFSINS